MTRPPACFTSRAAARPAASRRFALEQQDRRLAQGLRRQPAGFGQRIGAGRHDDLVGAVGIDADEGGAGRRRDARDMARSTPSACEQRQRDLGESIAPDGSEKRDLRPRAARGERLVGTLATRDEARRPGR